MHEVKHVLNLELHTVHYTVLTPAVIFIVILSAKSISQDILINYRHKVHHKNIYLAIS